MQSSLQKFAKRNCNIGWIHLQHTRVCSSRICLLEIFIAFLNQKTSKKISSGKFDSYTRMLLMNPLYISLF